MKLSKFNKKMVAYVCAIAMVVAGIVYTPATDVKAAAPDWSTISYAGDGAGGGAYANKYKFYAEDGNLVNIQKPGFADEAGFYVTFPTGISECSVNGAIQGAGIVIYLSNFTKKVTEFTVTYAGGTSTCYVYYEDGEESDETTAEGESSDATTEAVETTTANPWKAIDGGTAGQWYYNNTTKQNISSVVNIQKPGFADEQGIYITVPAGISTVSVNGKTEGVAAIQGAGFVVYLSALTKVTNEVTITQGLGTSYIQIKNTAGSDDEETTGEVVTDEESTEEVITSEVTTEALQVPGIPVGLVANLMSDNTVVYIAHGPASGTVSGYKYYINDVENTDLYNGVNYPVSNFTAGETYTLKVTAYNDAGEGEAATATFTIPVVQPEGTYDVTEYKANGTYPTEEGKIFAGWYADEELTTVYTESTGYAYAKFIDENVLTVKFQLNATNASDATAIRFLSSVDTTDYQSVGFKFSGTYGEKTISEKTKTTSSLYTKITAAGESIMPTVFSSESAYFFTYTVRGLTAGTDMTWSVTPFFVTPDGTTVTGTANSYPQA